jgi:hypothetical protein
LPRLISSEFVFPGFAAGSRDYGRAGVICERSSSGDRAGTKGRKTLIYQWVHGIFFIQTTFRFFRAETANMKLLQSAV